MTLTVELSGNEAGGTWRLVCPLIVPSEAGALSEWQSPNFEEGTMWGKGKKNVWAEIYEKWEAAPLNRRMDLLMEEFPAFRHLSAEQWRWVMREIDEVLQVRAIVGEK